MQYELSLSYYGIMDENLKENRRNFMFRRAAIQKRGRNIKKIAKKKIIFLLIYRRFYQYFGSINALVA